MISLSASARFGYGGKQFIARIVGRDSKFTFNRQFIGRKSGKRGENTTVDIDTPGLYETRDIDSKGRSTDEYHLVLQTGEEEVTNCNCEKEDAMKIAKKFDEGLALEQIVSWDENGTWEFTTPKKAESAQIAQKIDKAVEECWNIIRNFSEKEAKKIMAALKQRATPPKPKETNLNPEAPLGVVHDALRDEGVSESLLGNDPTAIYLNEMNAEKGMPPELVNHEEERPIEGTGEASQVSTIEESSTSESVSSSND